MLWLDLEMTGLDPDQDRILELAMVATDRNLRIVAESPVWTLSCPEEVLDEMDDWNTRTHGRSGLLDDVRSSELGVDEAERQALSFSAKWAKPRKSPMCGSSICQDRRFLFRHMPELNAFFHYRNFDVTSFKLAAVFFNPAAVGGVDKTGTHRAYDDVRDSIEEMRLYRSNLLISG